MYCREDARLVLDILAHEGLLELALHKSLLIGTSLEQTSLSVASFEFLYLEHLHLRQVVGPTLGIDQEEIGRAPGGGIITPRAGLFSNVLAFDFKSLYPSIMRTFNIDPLGMLGPANPRRTRRAGLYAAPSLRRTARGSDGSPASCRGSSTDSSRAGRRRASAEIGARCTHTRSS